MSEAIAGGLQTYPDGSAFTGSIGATRPESEPAWPAPTPPPDGAPNVMFVVLDDLGYAQLGCYSGLAGRIRTPNLDALAAGGLRYRNFHTTALCSPTRAALLTGRNHHSVGAGVIMERATGFPGYHGLLPHDSAMVPKVLAEHGYATYCIGKWHLTPDEHNGPTGPFDPWPLGHGFQRRYGFLPGETDQWHPDLWADNHRVDPPATDSSGDSYHLSVDLADTAITWLDEHHTVDPFRPFFMHFATGAPHSPHHAPQALIDSYAGVFDDGWEVFDDTLIFFLSDNGASAEGGAHGLLSEITYFNGLTEMLDDMVHALDKWGGPTTYPHYAAGWAYAGSTPQKWYKSFVHEGGTRDPMIVSWPRRIDARHNGSVRDQFHHVVDIATTVYELLGIEPPSRVHGVEQRDLEGTSLAYTFAEPDEPTRKDRQYFEMMAHRAIWKNGWKAVTMHPARGAAARIGDPDLVVRMGRYDEDVWELYHLAEDFSEAHDLAAGEPDRLAELQEQWWSDARRYNVFPLDDRVVERSAEDRPRVVHKRDVYRFTSPLRLVRSVSPSVIDRDHHIRAEIDVPTTGASGVLISNGGLQGGYTLCVDGEGHLVYVSNRLGHDVTVVRSPEPLPPGRVVCEMAWSKTDRFAGDATLSVDGAPVAEGHVAGTNPVIYAIAEGLEIGSDTGTPVWNGYTSPARFTGAIVEVALNTKGPEHVDPDAEDRIARYVQ